MAGQVGRWAGGPLLPASQDSAAATEAQKATSFLTSRVSLEHRPGLPSPIVFPVEGVSPGHPEK